MSKEYADVDCVYHGHSPSGLAIFISTSDDADEDTIAVPVSALSEDSRTEAENASLFDDLTLEIEEDLATEKGLL